MHATQAQPWYQLVSVMHVFVARYFHAGPRPFNIIVSISELLSGFLSRRGRSMNAAKGSNGFHQHHQLPYQAEATRPHRIPLMLAFLGTRSPGELPETMDPMLASKPLLAGRAS